MLRPWRLSDYLYFRFSKTTKAAQVFGGYRVCRDVTQDGVGAGLGRRPLFPLWVLVRA